MDVILSRRRVHRSAIVVIARRSMLTVVQDAQTDGRRGAEAGRP